MKRLHSPREGGAVRVTVIRDSTFADIADVYGPDVAAANPLLKKGETVRGVVHYPPGHRNIGFFVTDIHG
jgi:hypothetical protein